MLCSTAVVLLPLIVIPSEKDGWTWKDFLSLSLEVAAGKWKKNYHPGGVFPLQLFRWLHETLSKSKRWKGKEENSCEILPRGNKKLFQFRKVVFHISRNVSRSQLIWEWSIVRLCLFPLNEYRSILWVSCRGKTARRQREEKEKKRFQANC